MKFQDYEVILLRRNNTDIWERHIRIPGKIVLCQSISLAGAKCSLFFYSKHKWSTYNILCKKCCGKLPEKIHNQLKHNLIIVKLKNED